MPFTSPVSSKKGLPALAADDGPILLGDDAALADDFLTIERGDAPPLERCLRGQSKPRGWRLPRFTGKARVTPAERLARARAARALVAEEADDRRQWSDVMSLCLSERLDVDAVLRDCSFGAPSVPERLLASGRLNALEVVLPWMHEATWGNIGRLPWASGIYLGTCAEGAPDGAGLWLGEAGRQVLGTWAEGVPSGEMDLRDDGRRWQGALDARMRRFGSGSLTLSDGTRVVGIWQDDQLVGDGWVRFPDGSHYGGALAGEAPPVPQGRGRRVHKDDSVQEGTFAAGLLEGRGTCTFPRGSMLFGWRFEGMFEAGQRHGRGLLRRAGEARGPGLAAEFQRDQLLARCAAGRQLATGRAAY